MTTKTSKASIVTRLRGLIEGTQANTPNGSLTFDGLTFTVVALVQLFQKLIDAYAAADAAKASTASALQARTQARTEVDPVALAYEQFLRALYGNAPAKLLTYGLTPPKARAPLTSEQLAARAAKAKATRIARGTKGPKAKAAIKGTVPAPEASTTPATAAATPAKTA